LARCFRTVSSPITISSISVVIFNLPNSGNIVIGEETVLKHLAKLKVDKSPGLDKLHPRLLVEVRNEIKKPLSILFNQSINST
jgi:hypothetical protein